ncbi:glycoside hydrolase family 15 protein [Myxosarcina sp. GI1(2024)]
MKTYQPIENYGIIGNMHTTALIGLNGSIDWFCYPRHDSPSVLAAILDSEKGGHFRIYPCLERVTHKQFYWPETNVLVTRFLAACGFGEIIDFMPVNLSQDEPGYRWLVRQVKVIRCSMKFRLECYPAFNYARDKCQTTLTEKGAIFSSDRLNLGLVTDVPLQENQRGAWAEFTLEQGQTAIFGFGEVESNRKEWKVFLSCERTQELFEGTIDYWRSWLSRCLYKGRCREMVERSALALKLLTYEPTGAIIAAPTCGLPEELGGERNWDYRYTWIRDAAFTLYGLLRIGFTEEAGQFMNWLEGRCYELKPNGPLQTVYGINGEQELEEEILGHLEGYRGSAPVRIGNGAVNQLQLDIYGELLDSVYLYNKHGTPISYDLWRQLQRLLAWVCDNWQRPDEGIWEMRGGVRHFVYSKLMCWVALDRGLRLARKRSFPAERQHWLQVRDQIYEELIARGWSEERQAFVQSYGSEALDASTLIMPLVFFMSPKDPRMLKTIAAIARAPERGGLVSSSLVYRYDPQTSQDGLSGREGTFNLCSFWLVEALTRAGRTAPEQLSRARILFEEMLSYANHLGLYAEETGPSGEALGNFPQAFTHLALISAAWNLNQSLENR